MEPTPHPARPDHIRGCLGGAFGIYLALAAVGCGTLCWAALRFMADMLDDHLHPDQIAPLALWCLDHRLWLTLTALPALLCAILLCKIKRFTIVTLLLGTALLFLPIAAALFCLIAVLTPLYRVQPL